MKIQAIDGPKVYHPSAKLCGATFRKKAFFVKHKLHNGKGKSFPLQVWSGPEGSRKLSFPDY